MRVGATVSTLDHPTMAAALLRLHQLGHEVVLVISAMPDTPYWRARRTARKAVTTARTAVRGGRTGWLADVQRRSFDDFCGRHGLPSWDRFMPDLCAEWGARFVAVPSVSSPEAVAATRAAGVDVLLNGGGGIFKKAITEVPRIGILNAHMGPLPRFRGYNAMEWTLLCGHTPTTTVHIVDRGIDTGPLLFQRPIPVQGARSIAEVRARIGAWNAELLCEAVQGLADDTISPQKQPKSDGRQHYMMHQRLLALAEQRLHALIG